MSESKQMTMYYSGGPRDGRVVPPVRAFDGGDAYSSTPVPVDNGLQVGEYRLKARDGQLVMVWHEGKDL